MPEKFTSLAEFEKAKAAAWADHHKAFECGHELKTVRIRTISNGSKQYVAQCLKCGSPVGNPVKKEDYTGLVTKQFDTALQEGFKNQKLSASAEIQRSFDKSAFFRPYDEYLSSKAWASTREKVMKRARGVCEGCAGNAATEVHHLTYTHVGQEFLFELVALCGPCHERIHDEKNA